jgi:hypothetical protein
MALIRELWQSPHYFIEPCLANIFKIELIRPSKFACHRIARAGLERGSLAPTTSTADLITATTLGNAYFTLLSFNLLEKVLLTTRIRASAPPSR